MTTADNGGRGGPGHGELAGVNTDETARPTLDARVASLVDALTLDERCSLTAGSGPWHTVAVDRTGVPAVKMSDGPIGARGDGRSGESALCLPCGSVLGATWDPDLVEELGRTLGDEARSKGARVLLGPTVNLQRHPLGGRHFECYSEDPLLTGRLAVAWIDGVQSRGVGASIKHFVANDTEHDRFNVSSDVSARALRELYLIPFEMAVTEADPWTIMAAYNRLDGVYCCQNRWLLRDLLRDEWGYGGLVVSDWGAVHDTIETCRSGLDLEMPGPGTHLGPRVADALEGGSVTEADIDRMAANVLKLVARSGRLDDPVEPPERSEDRPEHRALARRAAVEGTVLLRNVDGLLPLDPDVIETLALIGPSAAAAQLLGGGSALVKPHRQIQPLDGFSAVLGADRIRHAAGADSTRFLPAIDPDWFRSDDNVERPVRVDYLSEPDGSGSTVSDRDVRSMGARYFGGNVEGLDVRRFACRWTSTLVPTSGGKHRFGVVATGRVRLRIDGITVIDTFDGPPPPDPIAGGPPVEVLGSVDLEADRCHDIELLYGREGVVSPPWVQIGVELGDRADAMLDEAVEVAAAAAVAVVVVGTGPDGETEGYDRDLFGLPGRQVELIERVAQANPRTVVVVNAGSPVDLSWEDRVAALVWSGFGGQEMGAALADVVFGERDPGGRLPFTMPAAIGDSPADHHYPAVDGHMRYGEDLLMGYRGFDTSGTEPRYPFGFGRSYAEFTWGEPTVAGDGCDLVVTVPVTNTSTRPGTEVVQLYVHDEAPDVERPTQELKAFAKVQVEPGATESATLELDRRSFAYWSPDRHDWVVRRGDYELRLAASSRDPRHRVTVTVS
jgi:beta-glucosidase